MSGIEIERMLKMIDANVDANLRIQSAEVLRYISEHEAIVADQLRTQGEASIPTSTGIVTIPMSAIRAAVA
jgi:hypothetical protein